MTCHTLCSTPKRHVSVHPEGLPDGVVCVRLAPLARRALFKRSPPFLGIPTAEKRWTGRRGEPYLIVARTVITDVPEAVGP
jgi:hypothetical protein